MKSEQKPSKRVEQHGDEDQEAEHEPDYRFTLANERTFLAWIRTALALLAGAVAVAQFAPAFAIPNGGKLLAGLATIISVASVAGAVLRWHTSQRAMRRDQPLPSTRMPLLLATSIIGIGVVILALMAASG